MTGPVRVAVLDGAGSPADARVVDAGATEAPRTIAAGSGRVLVGEAPHARAALVRPLRTMSDGRRRVEVVVDGWRFELEIEDAGRADLRRRATRERDDVETTGPAEIRAAIPGRVAAVAVTAGDEVEAGQTLLVVEAMKMQNELRAPRAATVERVAVGVDQTIEAGDVLVVLS